MTTALQVAQEFLANDSKMEIFAPADDKHVVEINNVKSYEGNVRLNKYLHLAQNLHIAMYGKKLFEDDLYAYVNGGVVPIVQNNYSMLRKGTFDKQLPLDEKTRKFVKRFSEIYDYAPLNELIEISHEDEEWEEKTILPRGKQKMDSISRLAEYKEQYDDAIYVFTHKNFGLD